MHKFRNLDGLRGIAALTVVFCHYINAFFPALAGLTPEHHTRYEGIAANFPFTLLYNGNFAVCIFFVLSGFVLSHKFFRTQSTDVVVASAVKRLPRLMLPALGSTLLACILLAAGLFKNLPAAGLTHSTWLGAFWNFPASLWHAFYEGSFGAFFSTQTSYNSSLWTMQYELWGSFLVFMIIVLFGKVPGRWVLYALLCLVFYKTYYLAFIIGVILSDLWAARPLLLQPTRRGMGWLILAVGLVLGGWPNATIPGTLFYPLSSWQSLVPGVPLAVLAHIIGAMFTIIAALVLAPFQKLLELRPIQYLGRISFSLYLLHVLVIGTYSSYFFSHLLGPFPYGVSVAIMLVPSLLLLFVASAIYEKWVDRPAIALSARIGKVLMFGWHRAKTAPKPTAQPSPTIPAEPLPGVPANV